jgi:hypothetical protein
MALSGDALGVCYFLCTVLFMRLRFGLLVSIVLVSILGGLGIAESRMNGSDGPITGNQRLTGKASSPISVTTEVARPGSMDLTRAEPLTNPLTWARENPFLIQEQARRIGWGPDLVDQVPAPARPGAIRLVVIGDSFVWGQGFEDLDERWVSVLQRDLDRRTQPGRFEVVPVGRGGTSSMNQAEWLTPERLARLEPDALVLGFVTNDFWPTFTERHFCQEGACAPTEGGPTVDCGPRCDIASCLLGEGIPTSTFLRKVLFPLFPNVTSWLLYRHCDMDRIAARKGLAKEVSVGRDHSTSPYWPLFIDAVDRFADWGGDIPRFVAHTRVQPFDIDALDASDSAFLRRGFSPVRLDRTHSVLQNFPDTDDLVVNPADPHPNSRLTHAYAADVASAVIERFADQIQSQVPAAPLNLLVSNHLPSSLIVENHTPSLARLTFDPVLADQQ